MKPGLTKRRMTKAQREWCKLYAEQTTFEPLMDDFKAGNESFVDAARKSNRWFEDWSSDTYLNISKTIPGEWDDLSALPGKETSNAS